MFHTAYLYFCAQTDEYLKHFLQIPGFVYFPITLVILVLVVFLFQGSSMKKKILHVTGRTLLALLGALLFLWLVLQTETAQNFIVGKITNRLSQNLKTEVSIKQVGFSFFNKMNLDGLMVRDKQKDTLLYASAVKVRITDWFFWRDTADLKYIGLEDAVVKIQRTDSIWNYQFLIDYFASTDTTPKKKNSIQLNLKKIDLKNIRFVQNDVWYGQRLTAKIGSLLLDAEKIDLVKKRIIVDEITLDKPLFSILNFDGLKPVEKPVQKFNSKNKVVDTSLYFNGGDMYVQASHISIKDGALLNEKLNNEQLEPGLFDSHHIIITKINGTIEQFLFSKDTIKGNVDLSAKERCGFDLQKLKAHVKLTPQILELAKLDLRTPKTSITDYYAMKYVDFNKDMADYVTKVLMDAHFKNSEVYSGDIAFFAPELKTWNTQLGLNGKFLGTVADFSVKNLFIRSSSNGYLSGDFSMKGLPNINTTNIHFTNGILQASYTDAALFFPSIKKIKAVNFPSLGNLRFTGNFAGTIRDFSTTGNISSAIGGLYADVKMKLPITGEPMYNASMVTKQFNLGKFVNLDLLGEISFKGKVSGSSFDLDKIKTTIDGNFDQFDFNGYSYANLLVNGTMEKRYFTGEFKANDTSFNFTSSILIDLKDKQPKFNILGDLEKADFKRMKLSDQNIQLTGLFDLDFEGNNIDAFTGSAKILNAVLKHDSTTLSFDSLSVNSFHDSLNNKILEVESNEFDARLSGQYTILDLPNSLQSFLCNYFPAYIAKPKQTPHNQAFSLDIHTRDFNKYAQLIDANLSGFDDTQLSGGINTRDSGRFYINTTIPSASYKNYSIENAVLKGEGDFNDLFVIGDIGKFYVGDSTFFPNSKINVHSQNDHSVVNIITSANNTLNDAQLNADVYTLPDGVRINFQPSSFVINYKKWDLEKQGEIIVTKTTASARNVKFVQGFQEITVETETDKAEYSNDLIVKLKDVNIGDFTPLITKKPRLEGIANGNIYLHDFYGQFKIDANLRADQFRLDDDSIGVVYAKGLYDNKSGRVTYSGSSDNLKHHFTADGYYDTKDSSGSPLLVNINLNETKVVFLNEFLDGVFTDINGLAVGKLSIKGKPAEPELQGKVLLKDASLKVKFTQVKYLIDSAVFDFKDGLIDFGEFSIRDERNNTGKVKGKLYEQGFKNMRFDFDLATDKMLLLNTTAKDNNQFYGKAIGKATLSLKGPLENMKMSIVGEVNDTTHIFIPPTNSKELAEADYIVFRQYGTEMKKEKNESTRLSIDLDLTANNKAQIDMILDELSGDVIKATGNGRLQIKVPATGDITMNGRYNIESGRYDFNFQSFIRKPFDLIPEAGSYIEWNGKPYDAKINIDAQYTAPRVSLNDLVSNQGNVGGTIKGYRGDVYVIASLTGNLTKPLIKFRLDFPSNTVIKNDPDFNLFLSRLEADDNEMLKQVTYLIVFGSFATYGQANTSANLTSIGINTISHKITGELNKLLSNALYKITGDKSLQFDLGTSTYSSSSLLYTGTTNSSSNRLDRQTVNLKINQSLLNGRIIITFGGDLDFNLSNTSAVESGNFQWLPDISVAIKLSPQGSIRAVIFSKSSLDVGSGVTNSFGRRNRQGVSLSFTKDFEKKNPQRNPTPVLKPDAIKPKEIKPEETSSDSTKVSNKL